MPLVDCGKFFSLGWKQAVAVNLLCTFDVKISGDCGVLCYCVSPMKVTKSCNQSLFTVDPPLYFHNPPPPPLSLIPECQCDVKGTLSGVGDCQQVSISLLPSVSDTHLLIKLWFRLVSYHVLTAWLSHSFLCLSRKVGSVTVSLMHVDIHVTPVRMDTSCCRERSILVVKVRNPFELNFLGLHFNSQIRVCSVNNDAWVWLQMQLPSLMPGVVRVAKHFRLSTRESRKTLLFSLVLSLSLKWLLLSLIGCQCDVGGAVGMACNEMSGQCRCRNNVVGRKCTEWDMAVFIVIMH